MQEMERGDEMNAEDMGADNSSDTMPEGEMAEMASGDEMPAGDMEAGLSSDGMPQGDMQAGGEKPTTGPQAVLVEMRVPRTRLAAEIMDLASGLEVSGFKMDGEYEPVPVDPTPEVAAGLSEADEEVVVVRGTIEEDQIDKLKAQPNVVNVWRDAKIEPFKVDTTEEMIDELTEGMGEDRLSLQEGLAACPIPPCDCIPSTPKGTLADVARYLGADQIWATGTKGNGVVIGIVDGGITAQGRVTGGTIPRVIGGWPSNWGTVDSWGGHGNMSATDALGLAPEANIFDIRIAAGTTAGTISNALQGYQWAINQHRSSGKPHILSNSWGMYQKSWEPDYATNPNHVFTRKVAEAVREGITVLFAAGNCGQACPSGKCGADNGPGKSIWGANGHPDVITVGAVNKNEQFIGYSSQGPAALDPRKPDFCSVSHFKGYFPSDTGTSAACPVAAGVVGLLKQANPSLTPAQAKSALVTTAKDIGPAGWDQHSGAGIIRAKAAHDSLRRAAWHGWESLGGVCTDGVGVSSWAANRLDCFVIGVNRAMYHKWWDGSRWRGWESLGGVCYSAPAAVSWGRNRIDTFVIGENRAMYHKWWDGSRWRGWESLGGVCTEGVGVSSWAANRLDCFVIGRNRAMYHKWWNGSRWSNWENLGGVCYSAPAAVSWGPNRIDTFVIGGDRAMYHKWWDGSAWRGWERLGGVCTDGVAVSSWAANRLDCFVIGVNRAMWHKWWDGRGWRGWEDLGGVCYSAPGAVSWGPNRIDTFVIGGNRAMYHKWWA